MTLETYQQVTTIASVAELEDCPKPHQDGIWEGSQDDLLLEEVYSKERGCRVEVFGIELDELWSFVQNKKNKQWIWLAINPANRQIIGTHVGYQSAAAQQLWKNIPANNNSVESE